MSSSILAPFQLLELNIISAQDLSPLSRSMRAYAVAWVHPNRKLSTRVDAHGRNNPTWNDKFVFRVDEKFLRNETSAVMIEIFALHWFRDMHVGTARLLVGNLIPPPAPAKSHCQSSKSLGMRFVALQVRRPSGRPQGILNIGIALLDNSMCSMPLYTQLGLAVGYRHLMGEEDPFSKNTSTIVSYNQNSISVVGKSDLCRTKSDISSMIAPRSKAKIGRANSMVSGFEQSVKKNKKGSSKASSVFSGPDIFKKNKPCNSTLSGSDILKDPSNNPKPEKVAAICGSDIKSDSPTTKIKKQNGLEYGSPRKSVSKGQGYGYASPNKLKFHNKGSQAVITQSELGPSPSEVAAAKAKEKLLRQANDEDSSVMIAWEKNSSVEGLQSKLERWRAELPPLYDSSFQSSSAGGGGGGTTVRHSRTHRDGIGGPGLFSCFSNICGWECSIACGSGIPGTTGKKKPGNSGRLIRNPSVNNSSFI